jgi:hypothetical protein
MFDFTSAFLLPGEGSFLLVQYLFQSPLPFILAFVDFLNHRATGNSTISGSSCLPLTSQDEKIKRIRRGPVGMDIMRRQVNNTEA